MVEQGAMVGVTGRDTAIDELMALGRTLPRPTNYYAGCANLVEALPRELLAFYETRDLSADQIWSHHRFALVVCLSGPGTLIADGNMHPLRPGEAVLLFPFQSHHYARFSGDRICWLFVTFELDDEVGVAALRGKRCRLDDQQLRVLRRVLRGFEAFMERRHGSASEALDCGAWMALLLRCLLAGPQQSAFDRDLDMRRLRDVLRHIHQNLARHVTFSELARRARISLSHPHRLFARRMGTTLGAYIRQARIDKASGLLHRTDLTIAEVGALCGFGSPYVFSRTFRKAIGVSPRAYRKANQAANGPHSPSDEAQHRQRGSH
ncbi:MAG: helix-turn-helix transcriptional regulator [Phycisphaeraceae bacterium]|nr:helix-turn-helix transcriptional regulator [Phycisphaeraceae bacterium]